MMPKGFTGSAECFPDYWETEYCEDCHYIDACQEVSDENLLMDACEYWQPPLRKGYKCHRCDACMDEGDRKVQAWKDGER